MEANNLSIVSNPSSFLDFETLKVQEITLNQLSDSYKENDVYGKPLTGIYHFHLINSIINVIENAGLNVEIYDMFAANNKDKRSPGVSVLPQVEQQLGEKAVQAHILRRVYANIRITNFDDNDFTTNIALSFTQKGVQIGFGNMVKVCHNQTMIGGGERYFATFGGDSKISLDSLLEKIQEWMDNISDTIYAERERVKLWKSIDVSADVMFRLIGQLTAMRIAHDTNNKKIRVADVYPLNSAQINQFTEDLMVKYATNNRVSLWDIYDSATELYKGDSMDFLNVLPQNIAMTEFLAENFNA